MEFRYMFNVGNNTIFAVDNRTIGNNDFSYFNTSVYELNKNRNNFKIAGQAQEDLLKKGSPARDFYEKWKSLEFSSVDAKTAELLMADISVLKQEYSFDELLTDTSFKGTKYAEAMIDMGSASELLEEHLSLDTVLSDASIKASQNESHSAPATLDMTI